ncbi:MAG: competence/damage-inducible protein A [Phycisphaerae bacterium]|jgi:nicotinamide-nucleotide amidase
MEAVIISIGTELTTGQQIDTNSAWLSAEMSALGADVLGHQTVGDDVGRIAAAIRQALAQADMVVLTGGLGPTPDDLTREGLAGAIDRPLEENPAALAGIRAFFERLQRPMPDSNLSQAQAPKGCEVISNPRGTAPGIHYHEGGRHLFALPGVPAEMRAMFDRAIAPFLKSRCAGRVSRSLELRCFGISEARMGELIGDLMARDRNPLVGVTASRAVLSVRITGTGPDADGTDERVTAVAREIRQRLGDTVFGEADDSLESAVARLLTERRQTVATAESCTGGLLAMSLTDTPGSSAFFLRGYVAYSNESKEQLLNVPAPLIETCGAVSEEVAVAMASGCRTAAGADFALSVTGIAGPGGGQPPAKPVGLVWFGMAHAGGVDGKRVLFGEHLARAEIRDRACKTALNLLRLHLMRGGPV